VAGDFLVAREPEHHLSLGTVGTLRARGGEMNGALVAALSGSRVVATAVWNGPWEVIVSEVDDERALAALVEALAGDPVAGVHAPAEHAESFADTWTARVGGSARRILSQRIYALERVVPPAAVPGRLRRTQPGDRELLVDWMTAFDVEAFGPEAGRRDIEALADELIEAPHRTGYVWEDGRPVSTCCTTAPTPNGVRVGAVYTPPNRRGRGYASALVAAVSQGELDAGRRYCFLFTDLANPTSNRIYQAIGYAPVRDIDVFRFEAPGIHREVGPAA
jgi:predicted GNAT family acetyltransferase